MDSSALLSARARDLVRERHIDPRTDLEGMRRAAADAVAEHEKRSLTGQVAGLEHPDQAVGRIVAEIAGFGPLQELIDDPEVEEVWINDPSRVFVARNGKHELTSVILQEDQVHEIIERMLSWSGRRIDISQPFVDATLPGGHRLHVVLAGIARGFTAINIRKYVAKAHQLDDLVSLGAIDRAAADFLSAAVKAGLNIIVSGGTQAGKTTLLNCLAAAIPGTQRLISAEEVYELQCGHPDWVQLQMRQAGLEGTGQIDLRELIKEALRMRPHRIIIGEVRGAECLDLLLALNAGLPGMASIHANSARQALVKLGALPLLAGQNIDSGFVLPAVASSVDLVVHVAQPLDGVRIVHEIVSVTGRVENGIIETEPVFVRRQRRLERGHGSPARREAFEQVGLDLDELLGAWAS